MKSKTKWTIAAAIVIVAVAAVFGLAQVQSTSRKPEASPSSARPGDEPSSSGRVTMIDLGANECVPCKMMAPIIEELKKEYAGRADIIFIDVWKDPPQAKKYGIRAIPTQIFLDRNGQEVFRHTGFMDKKQIVARLTQLGVEKP